MEVVEVEFELRITIVTIILRKYVIAFPAEACPCVKDINKKAFRSKQICAPYSKHPGDIKDISNLHSIYNRDSFWECSQELNSLNDLIIDD